MQYLFDAWCRDPRPLTFGEFLDEFHREREDSTPASAVDEELAGFYRECARRIVLGHRVAVCYVDIDHFREYRERYGRERRRRVIFMLSRILRDAVRSWCPTDGLVAHLGGDDFMLVLATSHIADFCGEVCDAFDKEVPLQYDADEDRDDRSRHRPPLALKIGVVTNEERNFTHLAQITELAREMMSYAKTQPGSVFVVDRRYDPLDS